MATWQKTVKNIIKWIGEGSNFKVLPKEKKYYIKTDKREQDYDRDRRILDYAVIPDVIWILKKNIKYHFEIEEKSDKWLIGTIMNGIMFAFEKKSEFILIVESKTHIKNFRRFENESGIFTSADVWEHKQETQQHQGSDEPGNSGKVF